MRQALELEFLSNLPMPSIVVTDTLDWGKRHQYIESFLKM
jgi:hypothetical protein